MTLKPKTTLDSKWGKPSPYHEPELLAGFEPRASDVLIVTSPKAGTTWMQQILYQIHSKGDTHFDCIYDVVPWLEFPRSDLSISEQLAAYELIPAPRLFKTHCTYEQTPGVDTVRIVLSSRDPRDCCVSFYHHMKGMTDEAREKRAIPPVVSFDAFFEQWLEYAAWFRNIRSWWPHRSRPNILWLRYEDMKADLPGAVDQLSEFLLCPLTREEKLQVVKHSSFDWMKEHASRFTRLSGESVVHFKKGAFIRKGVTGDYKTLLSQKQEARIMEKAREMLAEDCLEFLGL